VAGPPRIKDIARQLGISTASVSRALNDKPGVSEDLRARISALATEVGFTPNGAGRGLSTARAQALGFVVHHKWFPASRDPFYLVIMHGIEEEATRRGYHVILASVGRPGSSGPASDLRLVREGRVDGLILAGPDIDVRVILGLRHAGVPLTLVDNRLPHTALDVVLSDDRVGACDAVRHLLEHGRRRIAFIGGPPTWASTADRRAGYETALGRSGGALVIHCDETTADSGYAAMGDLLTRRPRPDALLAVNDSMAFGAMRALREQGLTVPRDVAIVGYDDIYAAQHTTPPLTTVRVSKEQMGVMAARRLLDRIADPASPPVSVYIGTELIIRQSCGCPAPLPAKEVMADPPPAAARSQAPD
jgi:LacI family transcriptional regulator